MNFLEYLNNKQSKLNMSQNNFAIYLGVGKGDLSRIVTEARKPSAAFIYRVCTKFNDDKLIGNFLKERVK